MNNLRIAVVGHVMAKGFLFDLVDYLKIHTAETVFIGHPLLNKSNSTSFCWRYKGLQLSSQEISKKHYLPNSLKYIRDVILTWQWLRKEKEPFDLYIGVDALNAFTGVWLRKVRCIRRTVLWTIDYVPQRFGNPILNEIYHCVDHFCLTQCDLVWNLSPRMAEGRAKIRGLSPEMCVPQLVVPHGVALHNIQQRSFEEIDRYAIAFMGHIVEKSGVQLVIEALPLIRQRLPQAHMIIIGNGPYVIELKKQVRQLGLEGCVEFTGYIEDHRIVEDKLAQCAVGVAIYNPALDDFTYYADPGKVKTYLGVGMPVIITNVPWIAQDLSEKKCGVLTQYNVNDLANSLVYLLGDENRLREYRINALHYAKHFEYSQIFDQALSLTLGTNWHSNNTENSIFI